MKKILFSCLLIIFVLFISGCTINNDDEQFYIGQTKTYVMNVGEQLPFKNIKYNEQTNILINKFNFIYANKPGEILIDSDEGQYLVVIKEEYILNTETKQLLSVNEMTSIITNILPARSKQDVTYESSDTDILTVTDRGKVKGIAPGVARVKVISLEYKIFKEITFIVLDKDEIYYEDIISVILQTQNKDLNEDDFSIMEGIINYNKMSLIGVSTYYIDKFDKVMTKDFGSGIIYKMNIQYHDGTIKENVTSLSNETNIKNFEYYVITNNHLLYNKNLIKVYIGPEHDEIQAEFIQNDDKIDLAVIKFTSSYYFPIAKLGDSDNISKGEFVLSIGHGTSKDYFRSSTYGIISSTKRYVATDTDNDGISDWDSEYIQHDASLNECDSGGAIMNLKGEIIGINSTKIGSELFNNMSFAIPINTVMEIVYQLEEGRRPQRATLGVSIIDISKYWENPDGYLANYPYMQIPNDLKYGFYVTEVNKDSIAEKAEVKKGDIIISIDNVTLKYSYQVRAELGKHLIGSGDKVEMKVIRNNQIITLYLEF